MTGERESEFETPLVARQTASVLSQTYARFTSYRGFSSRGDDGGIRRKSVSASHLGTSDISRIKWSTSLTNVPTHIRAKGESPARILTAAAIEAIDPPSMVERAMASTLETARFQQEMGLMLSLALNPLCTHLFGHSDGDW